MSSFLKFVVIFALQHSWSLLFANVTCRPRIFVFVNFLHINTRTEFYAHVCWTAHLIYVWITKSTNWMNELRWRIFLQQAHFSHKTIFIETFSTFWFHIRISRIVALVTLKNKILFAIYIDMLNQSVFTQTHPVYWNTAVNAIY